jgi:amidase
VNRELVLKPATEQAALVRGGEVSAQDLVQASLELIERLNPQLNAFVALCPERAVGEARAVMPGDGRPLAGLPIAIKDSVALTDGLPTTQGSRATGDWVPDHDSAVVRRLRDAGAIVVGKTSTPEFALRPVTEPARYGPVRNPWDVRMTPGGSSGGSGAAVAACMVALGHGGDVAGSLRIPASCCGLVGLKPSRGRLSLAPDLAEVAAGFFTEGMLARTVADAAAALDVLAGYEPGDPYWAPPPPIPFAEAARRPPGEVRVAVCLEAPGDVPVEPACAEAARMAGAVLEELGHDVHEARPDWEDERFQAHWSVLYTVLVQDEIRTWGRLRGEPLDPARLEPGTRASTEQARPVSAPDYLEAVDGLRALARRIVRSLPPRGVLVTPTLTRPPAPVGGVAPGEAVRFSALTRLWNVTGQPAISLPLHETDDGLPVGVQLVGPPGDDALLLSLATQIEAARGWRPRRPPAALAAALAGGESSPL